MNFYDRLILPRIVNLACGAKPTMRQREKVVPMAAGRVLELGAGSGLNLAYYRPEQIERLYALEPSLEMWALAQKRAGQSRLPLEHLPASAEEIPLESAAVDTVLITYTLCTIPDLPLALAEVKRVLRLDGELIFCEHGRAPDPNIQRWQDRLTPFWKRWAGGCHLNRDIPALLKSAGFQINRLESGYLPGPKPMTFNYWGTATHAT